MINLKIGRTSLIIGLTWQTLSSTSKWGIFKEIGPLKRSVILTNQSNDSYMGSGAKVPIGAVSGAAALASHFKNGMFLLSFASESNEQNVWLVEIRDGVVTPGTDRIMREEEAIARIKYTARIAQKENIELPFFGNVPNLKSLAAELEIPFSSLDLAGVARLKDIKSAKITSLPMRYAQNEYKKQSLIAVGAMVALVGLLFLPKSAPEVAPVQEPISAAEATSRAVKSRLDFAQKDLGKRAAVGDFVANAFDAVGYLEISPLGWQLDKIECEPVARSCKAIYQNTGVGYNSDLLDVAKENPVVFSDDGRYAELAIEFDAESSFNSKLWFEHLPSHFVYQTEAFKPMQLAAASKKATIRANAPKAYKKPVGDWDVKRGEFVLNGENVWALIELSELIDDFVFFPSSLKLSYQPGRDLVSWILEGDYVFN